MARGPGVMSSPYPSVTLHLPDGSTQSTTNQGYYTYKFEMSGPDSERIVWVVLSANTEITYNGKKYKFQRWELSGIIPQGLDVNSAETESEHYDEASGEMLVHIHYYTDDEEYGTVVIEPSAIPTAGGTASASVTTWTGKIGSSFDSILTAKENTGYAFVRWSDNGAKTHTITETVLSTGTRYVRPIAYFRPTSGLIIRSSRTPNLILRGSSGKILRDE